MADETPRWRRRKTARPGEIAAAALAVFSEKGFAAARLEEIAARAGLSKAALYLYFPTKSELFRAVVAEAVSPDVAQVRAMVDAYDGPFAAIAPVVLAQVAALARRAPVGPVAKMAIGESRNFPELAQVWREAVVGQALDFLSGLIARAQARGEVAPGDPRLHAMSLMGAMLMGILWREVMEPVGGEPVDLEALAAQHARTALRGLLTEQSR